MAANNILQIKEVYALPIKEFFNYLVLENIEDTIKKLIEKWPLKISN